MNWYGSWAGAIARQSNDPILVKAAKILVKEGKDKYTLKARVNGAYTVWTKKNQLITIGDKYQQ